MISKSIKIMIALSAITLMISSIVGCVAATPVPDQTSTATNTATAIPTKTPIPTNTMAPTKTITNTPEPSPTATVLPVPTISINKQSAVSLADICRPVIDGLTNLKKDLGLPDHYQSENPFRQDGDFDPNHYFDTFMHLKPEPGYQLDYVYFNDEWGGLPLVYTRKSSSAPFQSYSEFLKFYGEEVTEERSWGRLRHSYDYLERIQIDKTPESYFEFLTLAFLGDQFYLWWHALYNDVKILCDPSDMQSVHADLAKFDIELPQDVIDGLDVIDFTPYVIVEEKKVTIRFTNFTKWGGFFENVYVMDREHPWELIDVQNNPLIEYDCGISF